ncbi:hypothetical protein Tco_0190197 [Tanacetum coccineum]
MANTQRVWKSVRYGVSKELDTAYWGFLGVGTMLDIFQNIIFIPYLEYSVLSLSGYGVLSFILYGLCQKYTTSITKTWAADYGQVKWIEDKLTNLNLEEWYVLNVALRVFTRRIVIQERVEDQQLGVKSYQKKINLKNPDTYRSNLRRMTPYTLYPDIQGIIYEYEMNRNCLMRTDKLHKFSDGTLNRVRTALNDIALGIEMEYLPKRKWSKKDMQRARVMINAIDKKLRDRRLMRSLEKFVGGTPYGGDLRLLERAI